MLHSSPHWTIIYSASFSTFSRVSSLLRMYKRTCTNNVLERCTYVPTCRTHCIIGILPGDDEPLMPARGRRRHCCVSVSCSTDRLMLRSEPRPGVLGVDGSEACRIAGVHCASMRGWKSYQYHRPPRENCYLGISHSGMQGLLGMISLCFSVHTKIDTVGAQGSERISVTMFSIRTTRPEFLAYRMQSNRSCRVVSM